MAKKSSTPSLKTFAKRLDKCWGPIYRAQARLEEATKRSNEEGERLRLAAERAGYTFDEVVSAYNEL